VSRYLKGNVLSTHAALGVLERASLHFTLGSDRAFLFPNLCLWTDHLHVPLLTYKAILLGTLNTESKLRQCLQGSSVV
jgi:hypothetical protein